MAATVFTVTLPDIGEGVVEGEVIEWLKKVDDPVKQDEPVVVVMTDKATVELPAPYPGKIAKLHYKAGDIARKGLPLYDIAVAAGITPSQQRAETKASPESAPKAPPVTSTQPPEPILSGEKGLATPPVRHMARKLGISLGSVPGTGKDGRVTVEDLRQFSQKTAHTDSARHARAATRLEGDEEVPLIGIRKLTAQHMAESKAIIPHFSYFDRVDATRLLQLRNNLKQKAKSEGIALTFMPFFIRALSLALRTFPHVNASVDMNQNVVIVHKKHNVGIAMSSRNGLIVPVLKDVQDMKLADVIRAFNTLKVQALASKLDPRDMQDSTITISNFGTLGNGGLFATPIINLPEAAILGVAKIHEEPIAKHGEVIVKDVLNLSWSFDHRIIDGDTAAAFSHEYVSLLENPSQLL